MPEPHPSGPQPAAQQPRAVLATTLIRRLRAARRAARGAAGRFRHWATTPLRALDHLLGRLGARWRSFVDRRFRLPLRRARHGLTAPLRGVREMFRRH